MSGATVLIKFRRELRSLACDQRGVSAVEFALLLPLMLTLYLGSTEISQGISADRKVTLTAYTVTDLAAEVTKITDADMANILDASTTVISPFNVSLLAVTVSSINIDSNGKATIAWSDTRGGTARAVGSAVTLPAALSVPNSSLIWGEASYQYTPVVGYVLTGTLNLHDQMYMHPRLSASVTRSAT